MNLESNFNQPETQRAISCQVSLPSRRFVCGQPQSEQHRLHKIKPCEQFKPPTGSPTFDNSRVVHRSSRPRLWHSCQKFLKVTLTQQPRKVQLNAMPCLQSFKKHQQTGLILLDKVEDTATTFSLGKNGSNILQKEKAPQESWASKTRCMQNDFFRYLSMRRLGKGIPNTEDLLD